MPHCRWPYHECPSHKRGHTRSPHKQHMSRSTQYCSVREDLEPGNRGPHPEVEDKPGGDALAHDVDEEVGDGKEPHIGILQAVLNQQRQQPWFVLLLICTAHSGSSHVAYLEPFAYASADLKAHKTLCKNHMCIPLYPVCEAKLCLYLRAQVPCIKWLFA